MNSHASVVETAGPVGRPARTTSASGVLATFDVFETVLVRRIDPPRAVFDELGRRAAERGWVTCSPHAFGSVRAVAEQRAERVFGDSSTLEHIYAQVGAALLLPPELLPQLAEAEMDLEAELLRPVPSLHPVLQQERSRSGRVVFVSDMYLPASFIEAQLRRHGVWEPGDVLYVSHAHGLTKRSGRLYDVVARAEGVPVQRLRHHGNNRAADIVGARRAGAQAVMLSAGNPTRYEAVLGRHRQGTDGLTASMAGASRLARLDMAAAGRRETALVDAAAGVVAPLLTAYVVWLLRRAEALGLRRLYFDGPDGHVLRRVAQRLTPALGLDLELRHLDQGDLDGAPVEPGGHEVMRTVQEQGPLGVTPHGFVWLDGRETSRDVLQQLWPEQATSSAHGLFFAREGSEHRWGDRRDAFASEAPPLGRSQLALMAAFCSVGGDLQPLLHGTLDSYVEHLAADGRLPHSRVDVRPALDEVMWLFSERPARAEVEAWAGLPREAGPGGRDAAPLAAAVRLQQLAVAPFSPRAREAVAQARRTEWLAASLVLTGPLARLLVWPRPASSLLARGVLDRFRRRVVPRLRAMAAIGS